jgi:hypothetical protein
MAKGFKSGGRQMGTPNKINALIKERLSQYLSDEFTHITTHLDELTTSERCKLFVALSRLVISPPEKEMPYVDPPVIVVHGNL